MKNAYDDGLDLIQNMKAMTTLVDELKVAFSEVEPSMDVIFELRDNFEHLSVETTTIINNYKETIVNKSEEADTMIKDCEAKFEQITNDIEALVDLEANFATIKDKVDECLTIREELVHIDDRIQEIVDNSTGFVWMRDSSEFVPIDQRKESKFYLNVTDSVEIIGKGTKIIVNPSMAMVIE